MKDWKKEFDKKFDTDDIGGVYLIDRKMDFGNEKENVKSFISSLLLSQRKEVIEEAKKIVENYYSFVIDEYEQSFDRDLVMLAFDFHSRKVACKHILENLNKLK